MLPSASASRLCLLRGAIMADKNATNILFYQTDRFRSSNIFLANGLTIRLTDRAARCKAANFSAVKPDSIAKP